MKKFTKNILFASGISLAGIAMSGVFCGATAAGMLHMALDREEPEFVRKRKARFKRSKEYTDFEKEVSAAAGRLEQSNFETVEIISRDGIRLVGHWYPCQHPRRIVIAMHGWRSSWSRDFGTVADFWFQNHCNVLFAEQRGQNNSGGDYMGFGMLERYDCLDWVQWVDARFNGKLPIYLGGLSMGATTVLMAAGLGIPQTVHGIVADCGFTSPHEIWKYVTKKNLHLPYGIHGIFANDLCRKRIHIGAKDCSSVDALRDCTVPVLFIHGTDDRLVPIEMTYENYKACNAPKRLFVVPGADHAMSYHIDKTGYESAVKQFWQEYD